MCVVCLVKRNNVIFALTHHGGHLGYFEGGIVLPNSVTWLDRIVVEFGKALLHCKTEDLQQRQCTSINSSLANNGWLSKRLVSASDTSDADEDDDNDDDDIVMLQRQQEQEFLASTSPSSNAGTENKLAAEMVAEILRVSASMVCNDAGSVLPHESKELVDDGDDVRNQ